MKRNGRELWIRADSASLHKLLNASNSTALNEMKSHCHVGKEVTARVRLISADAAYFRGKVNHHVGTRVAVHALNIGLVGQVIVTPARDKDVGNPARTEAFNHSATKKAGPAGEEDAGGGEVHSHFIVSRIGIPVRAHVCN